MPVLGIALLFLSPIFDFYFISKQYIIFHDNNIRSSTLLW